MVKQKEVKLDQPINHTTPPTIYGTKLIPSLSNAALNLTIDFIRQSQSKANQHIIKHPYTTILIIFGTLCFSYWKIGWIIKIGGWKLLKKNNQEIINIFIFITMYSSLILTILTKSTDFIKEKSNQLINYNEDIFGIDLKIFAKLNINSTDSNTKKLISKGENTQIIIYRDSPIAVISLIHKPELSNKEKFVTKITGCGIRKVYYKSGLIEDLIDWSIYRSNLLNAKKSSKLIILIDVMSIDFELKKKLTLKNFKFITKSNYNNSKILKIFGIYNEIWGLNLNVSKINNDEIEKIKSNIGATGVGK